MNFTERIEGHKSLSAPGRFSTALLLSLLKFAGPSQKPFGSGSVFDKEHYEKVYSQLLSQKPFGSGSVFDTLCPLLSQHTNSPVTKAFRLRVGFRLTINYSEKFAKTNMSQKPFGSGSVFDRNDFKLVPAQS